MTDDGQVYPEETPRPEWDDPYLEEVAKRVTYHYDLEKDRDLDGTVYDMYGLVQVESRTHIFHPLLNYGNHYSYEHFFAKRRRFISVSDLERQVELGHDLASRWIVPDEEHHNTDFTFITIVEEIPDDVRQFVESYQERNLLKLGFHGHYEINLIVVAPETESIAASGSADLHRAFATWQDVENPETPGFFGRVLRSIRR